MFFKTTNVSTCADVRRNGCIYLGHAIVILIAGCFFSCYRRVKSLSSFVWLCSRFASWVRLKSRLQVSFSLGFAIYSAFIWSFSHLFGSVLFFYTPLTLLIHPLPPFLAIPSFSNLLRRYQMISTLLRFYKRMFFQYIFCIFSTIFTSRFIGSMPLDTLCYWAWAFIFRSL